MNSSKMAPVERGQEGKTTMCCYLYDPERRREILEEADSERGCFAHLPGYGPTFEAAMLMVGQGLLHYEGSGYSTRLRATDRGRAMMARETLRDVRRLFQSAANWEKEAYASYLAAKMSKVPEFRESLLERAWGELWRAAQDDGRARAMVDMVRRGGV